RQQFSKRLFFASVPAVVVATVVAVLVVTSGAPPGESAALAAVAQQAGQQANPAAGNRCDIFRYCGADTTPPTTQPGVATTKLVITGDSVALTLSFGIGHPKELPPEVVWDRSILGCPLFAGDRTFNGDQTGGGPQCAPWRADRPRWINQDRPDVIAVLAGVWEVYDRVVDGRQLSFATPEFDRWYSQNLDGLIAELSTTGARVALLTAPCNHRPDTVTGEVLPENDGNRIDHLNQLYREAARRHPDTAALVDLHGLLCPGGEFLTSRDGVSLRLDDGVHFSTDGAALIGRWLLPRLQKLADGVAS
ncbi:MAG TPA: SGNH hydrolase domain-containing protein, partial [Acidimicrobiia bacterium]